MKIQVTVVLEEMGSNLAVAIWPSANQPTSKRLLNASRATRNTSCYDFSRW